MGPTSPGARGILCCNDGPTGEGRGIDRMAWSQASGCHPRRRTQALFQEALALDQPLRQVEVVIGLPVLDGIGVAARFKIVAAGGAPSRSSAPPRAPPILRVCRPNTGGGHSLHGRAVTLSGFL